MLTDMSSELIEIDPKALRALLQARGLTRYDLAKKLDMSTKTVQRWLNESVRRIRVDTLDKLAVALDTTPEQLKKSSIPISTRTTNRAIEELCSADFVKKIRTNDDWENFLTILKAFNPNVLSSEQRMKLCKHIGISSYYLRRYRACRLYLNQAMAIASVLNLNIEVLDIMNWHALREETMGNFHEAKCYFNKAEILMKDVSNPAIQALYYYKKARLLLHTEKHEESILASKQAVMLEYTNKRTPNMLHVSYQYFQLGLTYLQMHRYDKARVMFLRNLRTAEKAGWVRGIGFGHFYLGITLKLAGANSHLVRSHFGKARIMSHFTNDKRYDLRVEKVSFLYAIFNHRYDDSKSNLLMRLKKTRNSRLHFSYAVLDGLFLEKLQPGLVSIRHSHIEVAREFFAKNEIQSGSKLLELLKKKKQLTEKEFLDIYPF